MTTLIVAFRNYEKAPKIRSYLYSVAEVTVGEGFRCIFFSLLFVQYLQLQKLKVLTKIYHHLQLKIVTPKFFTIIIIINRNML